MTNDETVNNLHERLAAHRTTLQHYLKRRAILGEANEPPEVNYGISEARREVRRIKAELRRLGAPADDHPDDGDTPPSDGPGGRRDRPEVTLDTARASVDALRRRHLEQYLEALREEYEVVAKQLRQTLSPADEVRLKRQMNSLEQQMLEIERELGGLQGAIQ